MPRTKDRPERESGYVHHLITVKGELRAKNQITLPKRVVEVLGVRAGDQLIFVVDEREPAVVRLHPLRESYAGALAGVYGTPEDVQAYLQAEREAWGG